MARLRNLTLDQLAFGLSAMYAGAGYAAQGPFGEVFLWCAVILGALASVMPGARHD